MLLFFNMSVVWLADYVGIEDQQTFEQLRDAVGERPFDIPMMIKYGSYPRYRLLVTYFLEKKGWSVDQLLFETDGRRSERDHAHIRQALTSDGGRLWRHRLRVRSRRHEV
jgi:hypothetical protein